MKQQSQQQLQHSSISTTQDNNTNSTNTKHKSTYSISSKGQEKKIIAYRHKSNMNQLKTNEKFDHKLLTNQKMTGIENVIIVTSDSQHCQQSSSSPLPIHSKKNNYDLMNRKLVKHKDLLSRSLKLPTSNEHECKLKQYELCIDGHREIIQGIHTTTSTTLSTTMTMNNTNSSLTTGSEMHESKFYNQPENTESTCVFGRVIVEIIKEEKSNLGLTVSDGSNQSEAPVILNIRPGSIADRSDCFLPYDHILSMNFTTASSDNTTSSKHFASKIQMEIGYELPALPPVGCTVKHMVVNLKIGSDGVGLVIRGGWNKSPLLIRPLTVMHIRQNSTADCDGRIKPGDRILTINNIHTGQLTCEEAMKLIQSIRNCLTFTIEYNVANFEDDRRISGAVVVEIEKPDNEDLGISLAPCHEVKTGQNAFFIDNIRQGSIADRCGALFEGDRVESIDDICVENMKLQEAMYRLKNNGLNVIRLQIVPNAIMNSDKSVQGNSECLKPLRSLKSPITPLSSTPTAACRCEEVEVVLEPYEYIGFGFTLTTPMSSQFSLELTKFPLIGHVDPRGPAFKSGVIQEGDRVICINGQSTLNRTIDELIQKYLEPTDFEKRYYRVQSLTILIQYTVADSVIPATGIFDVKLLRRSSSLGINLQASINKTVGQPLLISKVIPGSVASRSGSINPGDILLAVNGVHLSSCSLSEAIQLLQSPDDDIIILRIQKMDAYSSAPGLETKHGSDSSILHDYLYERQQQQQRKQSYRKSFDENLINKCLKSEPQFRTSQNEDTYNRENSIEDTKKLSDNNTSSASSFSHGQSTRKSYHHQQHQQHSAIAQQYPTEKLFPSDLREFEKSHRYPTGTSSSPVIPDHSHRFNQYQNIKSLKTNQDESDRNQFDNLLNQCLNSKLDYISEPDMNIVQVILRRKSPNCPWGITLCGTDDAPDIPVLIDSLNPGDPGAECGLIQPGDRILAINGITLHNGHTLTQAMRMLQHFPDKVILHIARKSNLFSTTSNSHQTPATVATTFSGIDTIHSEQVTNKALNNIISGQKEQVNHFPLFRKCTLEKAAATSTFSRSFDSISNSLSSNSASNNNFFNEQPLTGRTPINNNCYNKYNNSNSRLLSHCDDSKISVQRSKTLYDSNHKAQAVDLLWPVSGNYSDRNVGNECSTTYRSVPKSSTTILSSVSGTMNIHEGISPKNTPAENLNLKVPSNKFRSPTVKSRHRCSSSSSKRQTNFTPTDERRVNELEKPKYSQLFVQQYSDTTTSEVNDDDNVQEHQNDVNDPFIPQLHQHSYNYSNHPYTRSNNDNLQMDLNFIQCSGCRKAVEKEIKYYLSRQQQSFEVTRRASSSHRKDATRSTSEAFLGSNYFEPEFDSMQSHQQYPQHYSSDNNKRAVWYLSKDENSPSSGLFYRPSTFNYDQQQHSRYKEQNRQLNKNKGTKSHLLTDHHSKSDSRLDLIRSINLSDDSSDIERRNSLCATEPIRMSGGSSVMHKPQTAYSCQFSLTNPVKHKTISRIKSNTLGSPMNIKATNLHLYDNIQGSHTKKSKSKKAPTSKSIKQEQFAEVNTWCTWIRLKKASTTDSYGIGVSEGLSTMGIFISAIRPNSPADLSGKLYLYDRILMVNDTPVDNLNCSEVVNLISRSEKRLDLLVQRRITKHVQRNKHLHQNEAIDLFNKSVFTGIEGGGGGVISGFTCTSTIDNEHINITAL
ncbi:Glutamate receptor-interacting protein [Schistosoma japonicum]|uniref:Glutamate receptor-interacting protein n=1 Tax=Schistosoma japonicum TaxID=6182 RepID=A0A4Z2D8V8_SCHJA|nr:Glutamate receptor-interacting protein [Schistosoma japonicum]